MKILGNKLFWPSKKAYGHGENKFWGKTSTIATKHLILSVVVILLIISPTILLHQQKLNSNNIAELGDSALSTKGFNIVGKHFGQGQAMPANVVIENNKALDNNEALAVIDHLTEKIKNIKGVEKVSSITQPQGKQIDGFYISSQTISVTNGISKTKDGVDQIYEGLKLAKGKLGSADFSKVNQMVDGTSKLQTGVVALGNGLKQIETGLVDGSKNSQTISSGLYAIESNLSEMSEGVKLLAYNYGKLQAGFSKMGFSYQGTAQALLGIKSALVQMQSMVTALGSNYSNSQSDPSYLGLKQIINQLLTSLGQITPEGIKALNDNYNATIAGFGAANEGLIKMSGGLSQM